MCRVRSFPHLDRPTVEQILQNALTSTHSVLCELCPLPPSSANKATAKTSFLFSLPTTCHLPLPFLGRLSNSSGPLSALFSGPSCLPQFTSQQPSFLRIPGHHPPLRRSLKSSGLASCHCLLPISVWPSFRTIALPYPSFGGGGCY